MALKALMNASLQIKLMQVKFRLRYLILLKANTVIYFTMMALGLTRNWHGHRIQNSKRTQWQNHNKD